MLCVTELRIPAVKQEMQLYTDTKHSELLKIANLEFSHFISIMNRT